MTLPGEVVGQQHIARPEASFDAAADADFHLAGQGDNILAAGGVVPVGEVSGLGAAEVDAGRYLHPAVEHAVGGQVKILKMRLAVVASVDADEHKRWRLLMGTSGICEGYFSALRRRLGRRVVGKSRAAGYNGVCAMPM